MVVEPLRRQFGHAEWVDLPRAGNGDSFERARRRWDLADDTTLRYGQLLAFERTMLSLELQVSG